MLYRTMKNADRKLSILGFGCMRLPQTADFAIDEPRATGMIRYAVDKGVNYLDTAYVYHNGASEQFLGRALSEEYRKKVNLATKLPVWLVKTREDMDRYLDEQLARLQTDHIEFYLLHGLNRKTWNRALDLNVTEFLDAALADGRISHAGFSFHDEVGIFREIVDAYDWTLCQIQYNFMDAECQAGTEGVTYAAGRGLGIVVMEPLRGGLLTRESPEIKNAWASSGISRTPAEWGLSWLWNKPEISVVLSGMSTMQQVKENVKSATTGRAGMLTAPELAAFDAVKAVYRNRMKVPCTQCRYCQPCPGGIKIPECFAAYNEAFIYADVTSAKDSYDADTENGGSASACQDCGVCESLCPQHIPIRACLQKVVQLFRH